MTTPAQTQKPLTDADVVSGGPLDPRSPENQAHQAHADGTAPPANPGTMAPAADPAPAAAATPPAKKYTVGDQTFDTPEEVAAYAVALASRVNPYQPPAAPAKPAAELIDGKPIDQVMFDDPARYHQYVLQQATQKATDAIHQVNAEQGRRDAFFRDFYTKNPDLKDLDRLVQSTLRDNYEELANLQPEDAKKKLATKARESIDEIRRASGIKTTEVPTGGAPSLGAAGAATPKAQPTPEAPKRFADQVRALRKRA
jgi:hypothetical protein